MLLIAFAFVSCVEKDLYSIADQKPLQEIPSIIIPYDVNLLTEKENVRNQIAQALGKAASKDLVFRKELFSSLVNDESKSLRSLPVLKFFKERFESGSGLEVISKYLNNNRGEQQSLKSGSNLDQIVEGLEPTMVIEIAPYVRSFFLTKETIEAEPSNFSDFPLAFYPEVSHTNNQNVMVGYGDSISLEINGTYAVPPQGYYDGYIPIHVKRSRGLVTVKSDGTMFGTNIKLVAHVQEIFETRDPICLENLVAANTDSPDFLTEGKTMVNLINVIRNGRNVCPSINPPDAPGSGVTPPFVMDEICGNGIDDDNDGLIDEEDCLAEARECPDDAVFYRDCQVHTNSLTGTRFQSTNYYSEVLNPLLPGIENQVTLSLSFFRLLSIEGCEANCALDRESTLFTSDAVSVYLDDDLEWEENNYTLGENTAWYGGFEYFEDLYDEHLNSGRIPFFLIRAQRASDPAPPGARPIGSLGSSNVIGYVFNPDVNGSAIFLRAYVVNTNWVNIASGYENDFATNGLDYVRIGEDFGWDASYVGDIIKMEVAETDATTTMVVDGTTTSSTDSYSNTVSLTGSIGSTFGPNAAVTPTPSDVFSNTGTFGFGFTSVNAGSNTRSAAKTYTVSAERVYPIGSVIFRYQDSPNSTDYPRITPGGTASFFGLEQGFSRGHNVSGGISGPYDRHPFSLRPRGQTKEFGSPGTPWIDGFIDSDSYLLHDENPVHFINIIRIPE